MEVGLVSRDICAGGRMIDSFVMDGPIYLSGTYKPSLGAEDDALFRYTREWI